MSSLGPFRIKESYQRLIQLDPEPDDGIFGLLDGTGSEVLIPISVISNLDEANVYSAQTSSYSIFAETSSYAHTTENVLSASYAETASYIDIGTLNDLIEIVVDGYLTDTYTASYAKTSSLADTASYAHTSSWSWYALSSSYSSTASYVVNLDQIINDSIETYLGDNITELLDGTASYANTASYADTASYAYTSSWAISSSYALTASYIDIDFSELIDNSVNTFISTNFTASYASSSFSSVSSSWASSSISSSYAETASYAYTSSWAISSSYALTASYIDFNNSAFNGLIYDRHVHPDANISGSKLLDDSINGSDKIQNGTIPYNKLTDSSEALPIVLGAYTSGHQITDYKLALQDFIVSPTQTDIKITERNYNQIQDVSGSRLLGRYDTTIGKIQEIKLHSSLGFIGDELTVVTGGVVEYAKSSSWATQSISSSYAETASYAYTSSWAINTLSASWASSSISASYAETASFVETASWSIYSISASWASSSLSSSYALTASFVETASWSINSIYSKSASYAETSSWASSSISSSYAETASYIDYNSPNLNGLIYDRHVHPEANISGSKLLNVSIPVEKLTVKTYNSDGTVNNTGINHIPYVLVSPSDTSHIEKYTINSDHFVKDTVGNSGDFCLASPGDQRLWGAALGDNVAAPISVKSPLKIERVSNVSTLLLDNANNSININRISYSDTVEDDGTSYNQTSISESTIYHQYILNVSSDTLNRGYNSVYFLFSGISLDYSIYVTCDNDSVADIKLYVSLEGNTGEPSKFSSIYINKGNTVKLTIRKQPTLLSEDFILIDHYPGGYIHKDNGTFNTNNSLNLGFNSIATGDSVSLGRETITKNNSIAIGYKSIAHTSSIAIGSGSNALSQQSIAFGNNTQTKYLGEIAHSINNINTDNINRYSRVIHWYGQTNNTTNDIVLSLINEPNKYFDLENKSSVKFKGDCIAYSSNTNGSAAWEFSGLILRNSSGEVKITDDFVLTKTSTNENGIDVYFNITSSANGLQLEGTGSNESAPDGIWNWLVKADILEIKLP